MPNTSTELLERRILLGLAREWDVATEWLPRQMRTRLRPPLFAIHDLGACWGRWTGGHRREMAFSRELVLNHSWDAVVEVLRHELAHQLADEVGGAGDESSHGPAFLRMCEVTGANPRASIGFPPLDTRVFADAEPTAADHLLLRVRKLLALAGSPNSHEAELAMRKAHELMARYNLDLLGNEAPREYLSVFLGRPALRHPRAAHLLANLLQEYYFVRTIWASSYILEKERMGRVLEISGTVANVRVAHYVHDFVSRCMDAEWDRYRPAGHPRSREDHAAFVVGLLTGFTEKLCAQRAAGLPATPAKALLKLKDARLDAYFARRYPAVNRGRSTGWAPDAAVFEHGRSRGHALVIHRGVAAAASQSQDRRLLPPASG